jgi:hypothetical protein
MHWTNKQATTVSSAEESLSSRGCPRKGLLNDQMEAGFKSDFRHALVRIERRTNMEYLEFFSPK